MGRTLNNVNTAAIRAFRDELNAVQGPTPTTDEPVGSGTLPPVTNFTTLPTVPGGNTLALGRSWAQVRGNVGVAPVPLVGRSRRPIARGDAGAKRAAIKALRMLEFLEEHDRRVKAGTRKGTIFLANPAWFTAAAATGVRQTKRLLNRITR
jgi:hypothetical protein